MFGVLVFGVSLFDGASSKNTTRVYGAIRLQEKSGGEERKRTGVGNGPEKESGSFRRLRTILPRFSSFIDGNSPGLDKG